MKLKVRANADSKKALLPKQTARLEKILEDLSENKTIIERYGLQMAHETMESMISKHFVDKNRETNASFFHVPQRYSTDIERAKCGGYHGRVCHCKAGRTRHRKPKANI